VKDGELHITAMILAKRGISQLESKAKYPGSSNFPDSAGEHAKLIQGTGVEQEMSLGKRCDTPMRKPRKPNPLSRRETGKDIAVRAKKHIIVRILENTRCLLAIARNRRVLKTNY
jgi:hypothetical protein